MYVPYIIYIHIQLFIECSSLKYVRASKPKNDYLLQKLNKTLYRYVLNSVQNQNVNCNYLKLVSLLELNICSIKLFIDAFCDVMSCKNKSAKLLFTLFYIFYKGQKEYRKLY